MIRMWIDRAWKPLSSSKFPIYFLGVYACYTKLACNDDTTATLPRTTAAAAAATLRYGPKHATQKLLSHQLGREA